MAEGVLTEQHAAGHDAASDEDGQAEPPDGVEAEDGGVGYLGADDAACACRVHADLPPNVDDDAGALDEQRDAHDGHEEVGHVGDGEDMHEAEVAADVDDVGCGAFVAYAQLGGAPAVKPPIDVDAERGQAEREDIDEPENPQLEAPREEAQVGEAQQDDAPDRWIVRRPEYCREDACYEKKTFRNVIYYLTINVIYYLTINVIYDLTIYDLLFIYDLAI